MTWTYSATTLATTPKDQVRLLIGDTVSTDPLLQDEEILFLQTQYGSVWYQAAACARTVAASYSRKADKEVGELRIKASQKAEAYERLADYLATEGSRKGVAPYSGGLSQGEKDSNEQDTDRALPFFTRAMQNTSIVQGPTTGTSS